MHLHLGIRGLVRRFVFTASCLLVLTALDATAQNSNHERREWNAPIPPFRIVGNVYYVGAHGISSFLIASSGGLIVLDGGFPETAPLIERNIRALGFRVGDIKYLLNSHAHYDHCGGLARLKRDSGAQLLASALDSETLNTGHQLSYGPGQLEAHFPRVHVDRTIADGQQVSLGTTVLTAYLTPGHTKGCTTWTTPVVENGITHHVVFYCSTTVAGNQLVNNAKYPNIVGDYEASFARLRKLPCDVFLGPHPSFFHMDDKLKRRKAGQRDAFIDPSELARFVEESQRDFKLELARQSAP
ncbi:MAG: subclass B3 metallo-beta-lactamase [Acidobacteriaceae bacterium]|nr:subclass B3 metallo-beta-lactamase [Acidobacteriaceae bacterium]MBV9500785.1 subclass B3 metallo-beta-lactamase [Acidobacteriaceae bacterium]